MATYTKLTWPIVDTEAICVEQDMGTAGYLTLNGTLFSTSVPNQVSFIDSNLIRSVSITSTNNLSARSFVITGFQNSAPVQETITGPNNTTVYGTKVYDVITGVFVDGAAAAIKVGTGSKGYLPLFVVNIGTTTINYSMSVIFPPSITTNINYSVYQTLDQINTNYITFDNQIGNLFPVAGLTSQTSSQIATSLNITNFILLKVNSSGTPLTDTFDFIFLQV
jgi:hypothetical protein